MPDPLATNTPAPRAAPATINLEERIEHPASQRPGQFRDCTVGQSLPSPLEVQYDPQFRLFRRAQTHAQRTKTAVRLIARVITVSLETLKVVKALPPVDK